MAVIKVITTVVVLIYLYPYGYLRWYSYREHLFNYCYCCGYCILNKSQCPRMFFVELDPQVLSWALATDTHSEDARAHNCPRVAAALWVTLPHNGEDPVRWTVQWKVLELYLKSTELGGPRAGGTRIFPSWWPSSSEHQLWLSQPVLLINTVAFGGRALRTQP